MITEQNNKTNTLLITLFLFVGMYFPSSIGGVKSELLSQLNMLTALLFYAIFIILTKKIARTGMFALLGIIITLVFATLISELNQFSLGIGFIYMLVGLMFCVDFKSIVPNRNIKQVFIAFNIINLFIGIGVVLLNPMVSNYLINYYSDFFGELLPWMMSEGKPVLTFATHSIAGFYLHLFFYLNYKTFIKSNEKVFLIFSLIYVFLCFSLNSSSGFIFALLSLLIIINGLVKAKRFSLLLIPTFIFFSFCCTKLVRFKG